MLALPLLAVFLLFPEGKVEEVLTHLAEVKRSPESQSFLLTEADINQFVERKVKASKAPGFESLRLLLLGNGRLRIEAAVDVDKVKVEAFPFSGFSRLLNGRQTIRVDAVLRVDEGKGRLDVESAKISGVWIPAWLMSAALAAVSKRQPPYIDVTEGFPLPYGIDEVKISKGKLEIVR
ncbi:MAG: hypothetical protein EHM61_25945 [Acidobacteria bacterium]|nr:MAG: hypothetical protein EHM61_25945 [Acidobacteriota bacterium]